MVRFADRYWVVDGHNRVALALYANQSEIDATVVELVPVGGRRTEAIGSMSVTTAGSLSVRAAAAGLPTSGALGHEDAPFAEREVHGGSDSNAPDEPRHPDEGG